MPDRLPVAETAAAAGVHVSVQLAPGDRRETLRRDVLEGLTRTPKTLPPKWLYDERGSELFAEITRLPEYYLTRRERGILRERAGEVAARTQAQTLVELGSGTSEKTRFLLDALVAVGTLRRFVAIDVSEETLRESAARIASRYAALDVQAVVGDLERHLDRLPVGGRTLIAFLGSSIGNFPPAARSAFLQGLRELVASGGWLLLGLDLVKDPGRLLAAYDDPGGVTAAFNRNVLEVVNRELGADFPPDRFAHVARWDAENEWMELCLRSLDARVVRIRDLRLEVEFARGEELHTEISAKFRRGRAEAELARAGFDPAAWWTDAAGDFALSLARTA
ncbi:MAG: L-histidine N(alpha)-methyltransferase [Thermoleophilia bacterium]|nr:L-histidine N(alpha)-methyltransferase [Thermoleophilia bacterium]